MKKFQQTSILVHIWNQIANFEVKFTYIQIIDFRQNGSCNQKIYYSNVILFDFYSSD